MCSMWTISIVLVAVALMLSMKLLLAWMVVVFTSVASRFHCFDISSPCAVVSWCCCMLMMLALTSYDEHCLSAFRALKKWATSGSSWPHPGSSSLSWVLLPLPRSSWPLVPPGIQEASGSVKKPPGPPGLGAPIHVQGAHRNPNLRTLN